MTRKALFMAVAATVMLATTASADEIGDRITTLAENELSQWLTESSLIEAIRSQNEKHADLSQSDIDTLDQQWRAEVDASDHPLITDVLGRAVSSYLRDKQQQTDGLVAEVFIMDNRGLNVAQSDVTSDYWQGDEAKFQESFGAGSGTIHIGEIEFDESTSAYQVQISLTISDPDNGSPIGAATFGIIME